MNTRMLLVALVALAAAAWTARGGDVAMYAKEWRPLTPAEERVIVGKGTEAPFIGEYVGRRGPGTYRCRRCSAPLYRSADQFDSGCGWPAFDDEVPGAVRRVADVDGSRTEIQCAGCGGHLGHEFLGEGLTAKGRRHCVNSLSLLFVPEGTPKAERAWFAGGCFWGVEHWFKKQPGVLSTAVGYMGGHQEKPTYRQVCGHGTGHLETVEVVFDPAVTSYETLAKLFFEIHDPTQRDGQGPDVGEPYRSAIFYGGDAQKATAERLVGVLRATGLDVVTELRPAGTFWRGEEYHQDYYGKAGAAPYCHAYRKRF